MHAFYSTVVFLVDCLMYGTLLGAALMGWWRWHILPPQLRYLAILAWVELPLNLVALALAKLYGNNLGLIPFYNVLGLWLLGLVYRATLQSAVFTRWLPWVVGLFAGYTAVDSWLGAGLTWFHPGQQVLHSLLLLGMAGLYFKKLLAELQVTQLRREPLFWVALGTTIYFLGYLQLALFSNYLLQHYSLQVNSAVWDVHTLLFVFQHGCYCYALWLPPPAGAVS
jgi:hypothetical protein